MTLFLMFIPFLIFLIALPGVGAVAAKVGGWAKLAKVYVPPEPYAGEKALCSGGMGIAHYGFSLLLGGTTPGYP